MGKEVENTLAKNRFLLLKAPTLQAKIPGRCGATLRSLRHTIPSSSPRTHRILVTGVAAFIGSYCARHFSPRPHVQGYASQGMAVGEGFDFLYAHLLSRRPCQRRSRVVPLQEPHALGAIRSGRNRGWRGLELCDDGHLHVGEALARI